MNNVAPCLLLIALLTPFTWGDGLVVPPANYTGSLNEKAQEAILIFVPGAEGKPSRQDLILKITVAGEAAAFGWLIPLPAEPETGPEDEKLFSELHQYVKYRTRPTPKPKMTPANKSDGGSLNAAAESVEVLQRKVVGSYDLAVVRENKDQGLKKWLEDNQFQVPAQSDELIAFYRKKGYVFACIKVDDAQLKKGQPVDLHPIRFSFSTGGRDGIFFPMRMTGLQQAPSTSTSMSFTTNG